MAEAAAKSSGTVLITGETGVGKGVVARYIHSQSSRWLAPFVRLNRPGRTEARLEAELFGHVDGEPPAPALIDAASSGSRIAVRCSLTKSAT